MFGYKVEIESRCVSNNPPEELYGEWSNEYENEAPRYITKTIDVPDVISSHDIKPGQSAWLVWAEWSSGDSFGSGDKNNAEPLALFLDKEVAEVCASLFRNHDSNKYEYDVNLSDGQRLKGVCGWFGYFEHLDSIRVDEVKVI